jgi:hypothetical protein
MVRFFSGTKLSIKYDVQTIEKLLQDSVSMISIVGQCLFAIVLRVSIVWIYNNNEKCVSAGVVVHATSNI